MIGNFIADDIPLKEEPLVPEDIKAGILLHRKIDDFTDGHRAFQEAVVKLRPHHRKYAPVVLDILNDHLLSRTWASFHDEAEEDFHQYAYEVLGQQVHRLPAKASLHVHTLLEYEYLKAYGLKSGLKNVLERMDRRTRFPSIFSEAVKHLYDDYFFFEERFVQLYSDLLKMVEQSVDGAEVSH